MDGPRRWYHNPWLHAYGLLLFTAAVVGLFNTLSCRCGYYEQLRDHYDERARSLHPFNPTAAAHYQALSQKYGAAARRPWTLAPPKNPEP